MYELGFTPKTLSEALGFTEKGLASTLHVGIQMTSTAKIYARALGCDYTDILETEYEDADNKFPVPEGYIDPVALRALHTLLTDERMFKEFVRGR